MAFHPGPVQPPSGEGSSPLNQASFSWSWASRRSFKLGIKNFVELPTAAAAAASFECQHVLFFQRESFREINDGR